MMIIICLSGCATTSGQVPVGGYVKATVGAPVIVRPNWHQPKFVEYMFANHPAASMEVLRDLLSPLDLHALEQTLWNQRDLARKVYPSHKVEYPEMPVAAAATKAGTTAETELLDVDGAISTLQMRRDLLYEDNTEARAALDVEIQSLQSRRREILRRIVDGHGRARTGTDGRGGDE